MMLYLLNQRFPTDKAYGIQVAKTCEALGEAGIDLELIVPYRVNSKQDVFGYYDLKKNFRFRKIFSPDWYLPGVLDRGAFWIKNMISAFVLSMYAVRSGAQQAYSREELVLYMLSWFSNKSLIFEAHGFSPKRTVFYSRFLKKRIKIVAITQGIKDEFVKFGFDPANILVAPDGVDLKDFAHTEKDRAVLSRLNLADGRPVALYAGQLYRHKGADVFAEAARQCPEVACVFIGGTSEDVAQFRKHYGTMGNTFFLGHRPHAEIPRWLVAADVLVLPNRSGEAISEKYTSPLKLFEYMASGTPIIASDLPSLREVLSHSNAVLVTPNDPAMLARAIREVVNNPEVGSRLAHQARQDVRQFTWLARADAILHFING